MCGIVAVVSPQIAIKELLLNSMRDKLEHRGPDDFGSDIFEDATIGFGHRRLSILDLSSAAKQPMISDSNNRLIFNGEIYNFRELREELAKLGQLVTSSGDSEVLLKALEYWGERAIEKLNGAFAFCFWDQSTKTILVARDRFGEKPLFYSKGRSGVLGIASEMKALFRHPDIHCRINFDSLKSFADGRWVEDNKNTFFEEVYRVSPGTFIRFSATGEKISEKRYWQPNLKKRFKASKKKSWTEEFASLLDNSVLARTVSDVEIGATLSGGLDSSYIVSTLRKENPNTKTYSAIFPEDETLSEEVEIDAVSNFVGLRPNKISPQVFDLISDSRALHWHQEEPFYSASIFLQWSIAKFVKSQGIKVLLEGQGADELLAGYQFHFQQHQLDLLELGGLAKALEETQKFTGRMQELATKYANSDRRFNKSVALTQEQLTQASKNLRSWTQESKYSMISRVGRGGRLRKTRNEALLYNSLPMLLRYADRNSMAWGVESRLPFLDNDLVNFSLKLPDSELVRDGWQKWILRQASIDRIPQEITWRVDKVGYAAPLDVWIRGDLKDWAKDRLFSSKLAELDFYDRETIENLWARHQEGVENNSWLLWRWISIYEWITLYNTGTWKSS